MVHDDGEAIKDQRLSSKRHSIKKLISKISAVKRRKPICENLQSNVSSSSSESEYHSNNSLSSTWDSDDNSNRTKYRNSLDRLDRTSEFKIKGIPNYCSKPCELFTTDNDFTPLFSANKSNKIKSGIKSIHSEVIESMKIVKDEKQKKNIFKSMKSKLNKSKSYITSKL